MYLALTVLLVLITVFLHEYGHLRTMHRYGIKVRRLSIGVSVPYLTLRLQHQKFCFGIPVELSPVLIMGSVEPENLESLDALPLKHRLEIYGEGIIMNLVCGSFLFAMSQHNLRRIAAGLLVGILIFMLRKMISRFVFPLLSLAAFWFVPGFLMTILRMVPDAGKDTSKTLMDLGVYNLPNALMWAGIVSIMLALLNLIPLYPLDGGRIISACGNKYLPAKLMKVYDVLSTLIILLAVLISCYDFLLGVARVILKAIP